MVGGSYGGNVTSVKVEDLIGVIMGEKNEHTRH